MVVGFSSSVSAVDSLSEPLVIPTEMCGEYFFLPVTLAARPGYPEDRVLWFLYDTGASFSIVDPGSLERVSRIRLKPDQWANIREATSGPINFSKLRVKAVNLEHLSQALGRQLDGILAYEAFSKFLLTLDYHNQEMKIERGELPRPDGEMIFSSKGSDSRPWLEVEFPQGKRRLLLDSGAGSSALVVQELDRFKTTFPAVNIGVAFRLKKLEDRTAARSLENVQFGPEVLVQPILESTPGTQLIGGKVLRNFIWTFDQKKKRVRMVPVNPGEPISFESKIIHGMVFKFKDSKLLIEALVDGSPAALSDLQVNDVVTHFNGSPLAERGCGNELKDQGELVVQVLRDGKVFETKLVLFPVVQ